MIILYVVSFDVVFIFIFKNVFLLYEKFFFCLLSCKEEILKLKSILFIFLIFKFLSILFIFENEECIIFIFLYFFNFFLLSLMVFKFLLIVIRKFLLESFLSIFFECLLRLNVVLI